MAAVTAATLAFPSVYIGRSYRTNRRLLTDFSLKNGATTYQVDVDYQVNLSLGIFTIMDGGAIADAASVTATYSSPALVTPTYTPYSRPNRYGFLRYYEIDARSKNPRQEMFVYCNLIPTEYGGSDGKKYSETKMKCSFLGQPKAYGRY